MNEWSTKRGAPFVELIYWTTRVMVAVFVTAELPLPKIAATVATNVAILVVR